MLKDALKDATKLPVGNKLVGTYNIGKSHWITYVVTMDKANKLHCYYKDPKNTVKADTFEDAVEGTIGKGNIDFKFYDGTDAKATGLTSKLTGSVEQEDGNSCGLFAIKNCQTFINSKNLADVKEFFNPANTRFGFKKEIENLRKQFAIEYAQTQYVIVEKHLQDAIIDKFYESPANAVRSILDTKNLRDFQVRVVSTIPLTNPVEYSYYIEFDKADLVAIKKIIDDRTNNACPKEQAVGDGNRLSFTIPMKSIVEQKLKKRQDDIKGQIGKVTDKNIETGLIDALYINKPIEDPYILGEFQRRFNIDLTKAVVATAAASTPAPKKTFLPDNKGKSIDTSTDTKETERLKSKIKELEDKINDSSCCDSGLGRFLQFICCWCCPDYLFSQNISDTSTSTALKSRNELTSVVVEKAVLYRELTQAHQAAIRQSAANNGSIDQKEIDSLKYLADEANADYERTMAIEKRYAESIKTALAVRQSASISKFLSVISVLLGAASGTTQVVLGPSSVVTQVLTYLASAALVIAAKLGYDVSTSKTDEANKIEVGAQNSKTNAHIAGAKSIADNVIANTPGGTVAAISK